MTVLIAPDKFKGSLTAKEVCQAIEEGFHSVDSTLSIISLPLADGGEGTGDLLTMMSNGSNVSVQVMDPLFREIGSGYGMAGDTKTAYIEMAKASGLQLLAPEERNPLHTTSFGTGQLIKDALERGAKHIILGIGGSATCDAGIGMAEALGFSFLSASNEKLRPIGGNLNILNSIQTGQAHPLLLKAQFTVLCDVENPLFGQQGAAYVFGPQKGANASAVKELDEGLRQFKKIADATFGTSNDFPGAGAAGGLGAGAKVFLAATVSKGFDFIARFTKLEERIKQASLVITGEGKIDHQTLSGKVVKGVGDLCARHQKPCIAFAGRCDLGPGALPNIREIISLSDEQTNDEKSMVNAFSILGERAADYWRRHG